MNPDRPDAQKRHCTTTLLESLGKEGIQPDFPDSKSPLDLEMLTEGMRLMGPAVCGLLQGELTKSAELCCNEGI